MDNLIKENKVVSEVILKIKLQPWKKYNPLEGVAVTCHSIVSLHNQTFMLDHIYFGWKFYDWPKILIVNFYVKQGSYLLHI